MADRISEIRARLERANVTSESNDTWYLLAEIDKLSLRNCMPLIRAALAFCADGENIEAMKDLEGTISTSAPVLFMDLMEAAKTYEEGRGAVLLSMVNGGHGMWLDNLCFALEEAASWQMVAELDKREKRIADLRILLRHAMDAVYQHYAANESAAGLYEQMCQIVEDGLEADDRAAKEEA